MSEEIFVNTGTSFQQPYIARQPAIGTAPAIGTVPARTPTNVQTPFTYSNRSPFTYQASRNTQSPYIANAQQPYPYIASNQTPYIANARQPYPYIANAQQPYPYIANTQQPYPYIANARQPNIYQHVTNQQTPYIANARQPNTYQHVTNQQTPYIANARQPNIYQHVTNQQTPYIANAQQPYPYIASNQTPYIANSQTPFTFNVQTTTNNTGRQPATMPFAWGSLSGAVSIDTDISVDDLKAGDGWAFAATNFNVLSTGTSGGTIQISGLSDDEEGDSAGTATTVRNLTYTGGLDSLEGRFVYTSGRFYSSGDYTGNGQYEESSVAMIWHKTQNMLSSANVPHDEGGMTSSTNNSSITTEFNTITSGNSGWVALGRNAFTNTGLCSMTLSAAVYASGSDSIASARITGTWKLELRANGNSAAFTVWNQSVSMVVIRAEEDSS
jgi:hypothetical protein